MSTWYADNVEISSTQGIVTCAVMTNMQQAKRSIEVGCGPGKHSLVLASTFLRNDGGVLVSCDYSKDMVKLIKQNFDAGFTDYTHVKGNKYLIDTETDYLEFADDTNKQLKNTCDIEKIVSEQGDFRKFVLGCQANNELLPFPSNYFDSYLSINRYVI